MSSTKYRPSSYEWKEDYDVIPASNITHINVENMSFALNLRRSSGAPPMASPGKDRVALLEKAKQMREKATSSRNKEDSLPSSTIGQLVKDNGCKNSVCKQIVLEVFHIYEDSQEQKMKIQDLFERFKEDDEILTQLNKDYDGIVEKQQTLLKTLSKLDADVNNLQRKAKEQKEEQKQLEIRILEASAMIRKLRSKKAEKEAEYEEEAKEEEQETGDDKKKSKTKVRPTKKHNGTYGMFEGRRQWSCCLADREDAIGCVENDVVDNMSVLARVKNAFFNHTKVAPLYANTYRNPTQHHIIRYPMNSTDNLYFSFDEGHEYGDQPHRTTKVSMDLPPRPSRRPNTANPNSNSQFAPSNSFFTSASAMSTDPTDIKIKRPQTASILHRRSDKLQHNVSIQMPSNEHNHTSSMPSRSRPMSASSSASRFQQQQQSLHESTSRLNETSFFEINERYSKNIYNGSTVLDTRPKVLPENTLHASFRDNKVGKVRTFTPSESSLQRKNRPMSSPAGYGLYRAYQVQHHQPDLVPQTLNASTSILHVAGYAADAQKRYWSSSTYGNDNQEFTDRRR